MPNGRSGGFPIDTVALKELVNAISATGPIGLLIDRSSGPRLRPVVQSEVLRLVEDCRPLRVPVEEQDHSTYIIHLGNEPSLVWVCVLPESPLFESLRQRHDQWKTEHPGWNGWLDF